MPLILFLSFLFLILTSYLRIKSTNKDARQEKNFWQREHESNFVRRKDISDLPFIEIPYSHLPFGLLPEDEILATCESQLKMLQHKKILNLTGQSNTDLKMTYGAPNLPQLSDYDLNFTMMVRLLNKWGQRLYELSFLQQATVVLDYAITCGSDIKKTYLLLAQIYNETNQTEKIPLLNEHAMQLNSLSKTGILKELEKY
jgi:hypothetical protein